MFYISDTDEKEMEIPCVDYERVRANDDSFIHSLLSLVWGSMCQVQEDFSSINANHKLIILFYKYI